MNVERVNRNIVWTTVVVGTVVCTTSAWAQWRGPYPPYGPAMRGYEAAARIQVTPKETEVYVDGYYAGIADDFDGVWQRLRLEPGEHEIALYLEGHRTFREKFLFRPGQTVKLRHTMEPAQAGEAIERPKPAEGARATPAPTGRGTGGRPPRPGPASSTFGSIAIRVQPRDAEVLIDGERWQVPPEDARLVVQVSDGPHRVEIRKEGYRPYEMTVQVRRGETVPLNVNLSR